MNAIELLQANPNKINWFYVSENPNAIELLKANHNKIDFPNLSYNKNAIELLKVNNYKINWGYLSENPSIFELDYDQIAINFKPLAEEIIATAYDPDRIKRLSIIYNFEFKDWFDKN